MLELLFPTSRSKETVSIDNALTPMCISRYQVSPDIYHIQYSQSHAAANMQCGSSCTPKLYKAGYNKEKITLHRIQLIGSC